MELKDILKHNNKSDYIEPYWLSYNNKSEFDRLLHYLDVNRYRSEIIGFYSLERGDSFKNSYSYSYNRDTVMALRRGFVVIRHIENVNYKEMIIPVSEIDEIENITMTVEHLYEEMKLLDIKSKRERRNKERARADMEFNDRNKRLTDFYYSHSGRDGEALAILRKEGYSYKEAHYIWADALDLIGDRKNADYWRNC